MKKMVCLFSCLLGLNLHAMGDNIISNNTRMLYIICIKRVSSTNSLTDCPVPSPKEKTPTKKCWCPVSPVPKRERCCSISSPTIDKKEVIDSELFKI